MEHDYLNRGCKMNNLSVNFLENIKEEPSKNDKKIRAKTKGYSFELWEREWVLDKNNIVSLAYI